MTEAPPRIEVFMAAGLKQARAPGLTSQAPGPPPRTAEPPAQPSASPAGAGASEPPAAVSAWFQHVDEPARPAPRPRRSAWPALPIVLVALLLVALVRSLITWALLPLALVAAALVALARRRTRPEREAPRAALLARGLRLERGELVFRSDGAEPQRLLTTSAAFGVTLVASRRRDRLVVAVSSAEQTFYVGSSFGAEARRTHAALLARASSVVGDDAGLAAVGPDGIPIELAPDDLAGLLGALVRADPSCLDRAVLTDIEGAPLTLEGNELEVRGHHFDLGAPLEWRAIVFQEAFGQAIAIYQGTWIRQAGADVVLVALLPSLVPLLAEPDSTGVAELDRAAQRDARLMQAVAEPPPPREQRVAIDRLFMLPLRAALDRAPRPSRQPSRARA